MRRICRRYGQPDGHKIDGWFWSQPREERAALLAEDRILSQDGDTLRRRQGERLRERVRRARDPHGQR